MPEFFFLLLAVLRPLQTVKEACQKELSCGRGWVYVILSALPFLYIFFLEDNCVVRHPVFNKSIEDEERRTGLLLLAQSPHLDSARPRLHSLCQLSPCGVFPFLFLCFLCCILVFFLCFLSFIGNCLLSVSFCWSGPLGPLWGGWAIGLCNSPWAVKELVSEIAEGDVVNSNHVPHIAL